MTVLDLMISAFKWVGGLALFLAFIGAIFTGLDQRKENNNG